MKSVLILSVVLLGPCAFAQKATLVEDSPQETPVVGRQAPPTVTDSNAAATSTDSFASAYSLRAHRRMAVGSEVMGEYGLIGAFAELNFAADDSATLGFGGGYQYSTFAMNWRHLFGGKTFSPFTSLGISHWYANGNGGTIGSTTPGFLGNQFLTSDEKSSDRFGLDFIAPAAGIQYNILSGAYAGTSFYVEFLAMIALQNIGSLSMAPTASAGALYYF